MIKKLILTVSCLCVQMLFSQKADPIYYDKDWEVTTKANASFYRPMPLKGSGGLVLLQDFYMNGTAQFEGYTLKENEHSYVGDVVWYDANGNDENFRQYRNDTNSSTLLYYHTNGKIRKKVKYKNGVKDGEAIIYATDGTVLMKGIYAKGKPESGSFEKVRQSDDYDYNSTSEEVTDVKILETTEGVIVSPPPPVAVQTTTVEPQTVEMAVYEGENLSKSKKNRKTVSEKIFWVNSKQLAQETVYEIGAYDFKPTARKNYDKTGKLIQSLNETQFKQYGNDIENGAEYQYYLQNNFATGIKSVSDFSKGEKSGKEIIYFPSGNVSFETNYKTGYKEGVETVFNENGSVKSKRVYKENEPFNGNFDVRVGGMLVNQNHTNGVKEGEAIVKNEDGEVVGKGIYKNGKPFNGTFIEDNENRSDTYELINVENFKKTGLQKVFGYRLENIERTYTIQNEKLNGITTFYDDGKVVGALEYKNDEPYSGTLIESEKTSVFKNGKITEETYFEDTYNKDNIKKQKLYENGILVKVKDFSFDISERPQSSYEGVFKNGKPFSGYFETDDNREFKQVNYFENGILKFQYSNDYLKNMDNFRHQSYDIKSTYKDGKIYDGVEYVLNEKQFASKYWKNGVLQAFDWDLFAMHYFNRLHFELKNNSIEIRDMQAKKKAEIKINPSKNTFNKQLSIDGKLVDGTRKDYLDSKYKESIIVYHEKDGKIVSSTVNPVDESIEPMEGTELFYKVYSMVNETSGLQENFNRLAEKISGNKFIEETDENRIITGIQMDAEGKPKDGILITPTQNNTYTVQFYMNRKLMKTVEKVTVQKMETIIKNIDN
jgi:antitoxin component YwqK of YwqJK toxin-antitoxin module